MKENLTLTTKLSHLHLKVFRKNKGVYRLFRKFYSAARLRTTSHNMRKCFITGNILTVCTFQFLDCVQKTHDKQVLNSVLV